jgi:hypothetical protein
MPNIGKIFVPFWLLKKLGLKMKRRKSHQIFFFILEGIHNVNYIWIIFSLFRNSQKNFCVWCNEYSPENFQIMLKILFNVTYDLNNNVQE